MGDENLGFGSFGSDVVNKAGILDLYTERNTLMSS
jgi:hypothetical protein